jgi:glycosyltransferase involved in cell wall biosynthesis
MKFSIVMPTFNRDYVIPRALGTLLSQDYENWELIIVDDGSTDETSSVVETYLEDKRIKYLKYKENKGVNYARNMAIENATGDIITFLDSDDQFLSYTLYKANEMICKYNDYDVYSFASVSNTGEKMCFFDRDVLTPSHEEIITEKYCGDYLKFVRRHVFEKVKFDTEIKAFEGITWKIIETSFKPIYFDISLLVYWQDTISISRNNEKYTKEKELNSLKAWEKYIDLFGEDLKKLSCKTKVVYSKKILEMAEISMRLDNIDEAKKYLHELIDWLNSEFKTIEP